MFVHMYTPTSAQRLQLASTQQPGLGGWELANSCAQVGTSFWPDCLPTSQLCQAGITVGITIRLGLTVRNVSNHVSALETRSCACGVPNSNGGDGASANSGNGGSRTAAASKDQGLLLVAKLGLRQASRSPHVDTLEGPCIRRGHFDDMAVGEASVVDRSTES
jgi:hypothetical protein